MASYGRGRDVCLGSVYLHLVKYSRLAKKCRKTSCDVDSIFFWPGEGKHHRWGQEKKEFGRAKRPGERCDVHVPKGSLVGVPLEYRRHHSLRV